MLPLIAVALAGALLAPQDPPAPAGTSDTVRSFLKDAQATFYRPEADGLSSLAFVVPIEERKSNLEAMMGGSGMRLPEGTPEIIRMAEVSVLWEAGGTPQVEGSVADAFPAGLEMMRPMIQNSVVPMGQQTLSASLNTLVDFNPVLKLYDARFDGAEGDLLKVLFERKDTPEAAQAPTDTIVWLFDEDGRPAGTQLTFQQQGPMGGAISVNVNTRYTWGPARGDSGPVVLKQVSANNELGSFGSMEQQTTPPTSA